MAENEVTTEVKADPGGGFLDEVKEVPRAEPDFLFEDEKKKKKAKKKKEKPPPKPTKKQYESTLYDLNMILAGLRKKATKLDEINLEYNKKLCERNETDNEVCEHLTRIKKKKIELLTIEEQYNVEITQKLLEVQNESKVRITELLNKFEKNQKYLKTDIEILSSKLKTLCQFSGQKDHLIELMSNVNNIAKEKEKKHQDLLYAQHQKNVVIRNNIANQAKARYARIIDDFTRSREVRSAAYTRRLLSENRDLRKEYNRFIPINLKTEKELTRVKENSAVVKETYMLTKEITVRLERTQAKRNEILEKLQKSYDFYKLQVITGSKYRKMYEAIKEVERVESMKHRDEQAWVKDVEDQSSATYEKYLTLKQAEKDYITKRKKYDQIMDIIRASAPKLCNETGKDKFFDNYEDYILRRNAIIGCLTDIITSTERPTKSKVMARGKYYKGYLGMMPLDFAFCKILKKICCESNDELEMIPSFCHREIQFAVRQPVKEEEIIVSSDPAMRCVKYGKQELKELQESSSSF